MNLLISMPFMVYQLPKNQLFGKRDEIQPDQPPEIKRKRRTNKEFKQPSDYANQNHPKTN